MTSSGLVDRFLEATEAMLGTPYENGPLGEGDGAVPDPDPRFDFARVDCVTFLEQALALALAPESGQAFPRALDRIRYDHGRVEFAERNHFMATDWIPSNAWLMEDVTESLAPGVTGVVTRTIDRAAFLEGHGAKARPDRDEAREQQVTYIPSSEFPSVSDAIRSGDLVFWVGKAEGIFVVHTGLAVRDEGGALWFRHGSSTAGRVVDEPFAEYARRAGFALGFLLLRLRDDARAHLAAEDARDTGARWR